MSNEEKQKFIMKCIEHGVDLITALEFWEEVKRALEDGEGHE